MPSAKFNTFLTCLLVGLRLWVHEVYRVFYDRLVDDKDRAWLHSSLKKVTKEHFKEDFDAMFKHLGNSKNVTYALFCAKFASIFNLSLKGQYHERYCWRTFNLDQNII